jgi:mRNA-degrading endonuclease RelE of RelBE toxin-antitoxin system
MRGKAARRALVVIVISSENNNPAPLPARIPSRLRRGRHRLICDVLQVVNAVTFVRLSKRLRRA